MLLAVKQFNFQDSEEIICLWLSAAFFSASFGSGALTNASKKISLSLLEAKIFAFSSMISFALLFTMLLMKLDMELS